MELKNYQKNVLQDLSLFMDAVNAQNDIKKGWKAFWQSKDIKVGKGGVPPYRERIPGVPHVCMKVPTGGGKTFMACCAVKPIFDHMPLAQNRAVVWLVPSDSILSQTIQNLSNPNHPYRHQLDRDFGGKVMVYTKDALLNAQNFSPDTVRDQLSVCVMSYASLRINSKKKEDRKVFQENGNLMPFLGYARGTDYLLENTPDTALIQVLRSLHPVAVVDESHNATSKLSEEMLENLNPSFILELTATPRASSNVVSYVDARELKKENMVKLPVMVFNRNNRQSVLQDAIQFRGILESQAKALEQNGGPYIRPIVLFQAQPKVKEDSTTFTKVRELLLKIGIPEEQIAIKTADVDDLKQVDLMSPQCPIRYIITVNALKEGWDCPFAYILASLANKTSKVDVEQIVGRILRQPYARQYGKSLLNMSFVLTSSKEFQGVLESIVKGLNDAGFSRKDYRVGDGEMPEFQPAQSQAQESSLFPHQPESQEEGKEETPAEEYDDIDSEAVQRELNQPNESGRPPLDSTVGEMMAQAVKQGQQYQDETKKQEEQGLMGGEMGAMQNQYPMMAEFRTQAEQLRIPQFFLRTEADLFGGEKTLLTPESLTDGFSLTGQDAQISFQLSTGEMYQVDVQQKGEAVPKYRKVNLSDQEEIRKYLEKIAPEKRIAQCAEILTRHINKNNQYVTSEVQEYVKRVIHNMTEDELQQMETSIPSYASRIQDKLKSLTEKYRIQKFQDWLETGKITCEPSYAFPAIITPAEAITSIPNSLYEGEKKDLDSFEMRMLNEVIACSDKVLWWHRNIDRKGFKINGFINHYPDFIVQLKNGRILMIETKGDYLDGSDSQKKLQMGTKWKNLAGSNYRYYMVFDKKKIPGEGSYTLDEFSQLLAGM